MARSKIIILILIIAAFGAGIYFKDDAVKFYNSFGKKVEELKKANIGQIISQVQKQISVSTPLNMGGSENYVILFKSQIISETNLQRKENGNLPSLKENSVLDQAASAKAEDMFKNQYFEHVSPTGVDPGKLVQGFGYEYIVEGENLILGNFSGEKELVQDWMNSPGHRANILNNRFTEIGVAVVKGKYKGQTVWISVQEFGLPMATCQQPNSALKLQIDSEKNQLDNMSLQLNEKKNEIDSADSNASFYGQIINDYNQLVGQYNNLAEEVKRNIANYNNQINNFNNCVTGK